MEGESTPVPPDHHFRSITITINITIITITIKTITITINIVITTCKLGGEWVHPRPPLRPPKLLTRTLWEETVSEPESWSNYDEHLFCFSTTHLLAYARCLPRCVPALVSAAVVATSAFNYHLQEQERECDKYCNIEMFWNWKATQQELVRKIL